MTTTAGDVAQQIRTMRAETIAAIEQRELLGANARRALIAALRAEQICQRGTREALDGWGLEPLPGSWTVSAEGLLSYARMHTDEAEAREQGRDYVPDELYRIWRGVWIDPIRVVEVALIHGEDDWPEVHPYRISVRVIVRAGVTASTEAGAVSAAQATIDGQLAELADADITVTDLTWTVVDGPDEIPLSAIDAETPPGTGTVELPDLGSDLATVTAARDQALNALAALRRAIRHRAITALIDGEVGTGTYEATAVQVERFLLDLGLAALPRAHHITVVTSLNVRVAGDTNQQACAAARDTLRAATTGPDDTRPWTAQGRVGDGTDLGDGSWQITWWHVYEMWLRGHTDQAAATVAAETLAREDLTSALTGVEHDALTVTSTDEGFGVDVLLDPDTD